MTASNGHEAYEELLSLLREAAVLGSTAALLRWDQETMMPAGGVEHRARQLAQLSRMVHERVTDPRIGELLDRCEADGELTADPYCDAGANVRETRRRYDRATKLPPDLVEERARTRSIAQHHWEEARENDDFDRFRPWLEKNVSLARRTADCYGWADDGEAWDALADGFEPGMTAAGVAAVFIPLRERLRGLLDELMGAPQRPSAAFHEIELPVERQREFVRSVSDAIGFDFAAGRMDTSAHPFCSGIGPGDTRLTTRFRPRGVGEALAAVMHESGHGIYDQGLDREHYGTPLGSPVSLGIHESQSRMWENQVGRSEAFWRWCHPRLGEFFGEAVSRLGVEDVYGAMNVVEPSLIRVEADEATYNMHIMVRFDLERTLIDGSLAAADVPDAWNEKYSEYLGIDVPDDTRGCLQDIHWSGGSFGYFPTYTLGNLYCAQLYETAEAAIGDLPQRFERGDFSALKEWLNDNVHRHGSRYPPEVLCEKVTGRPLGSDPLIRHLEGKLKPLYGL